MVEDRGRILGGEEDVQVADRLGATPEAAADLGADHERMGPDRLEDRRDQAPGLALQDAVADRFDEGDPFEDLRLGLGAEALQPGDLPRLGRRAEVGQALDLQGLVERQDLLRPEPGDAQQGDQAGGRLAPQLVVRGELAGRRELDDLGVHRLADPRRLGQAAVGDRLREVAGHPLQAPARRCDTPGSGTGSRPGPRAGSPSRR